MVSKILLIVLISFTAVFASPILRKDAESSEETSAFLAVLKNTFGKLLGKFFSIIVESLRSIFEKIEQRLDSKEFRDAIVELQEIAKVIFDEKEELKGDAETKEIIQEQLNKVGESFQKIYEEAIENMKEENDQVVDASEFKNAVDELKQLVNKLYPN